MRKVRRRIKKIREWFLAMVKVGIQIDFSNLLIMRNQNDVNWKKIFNLARRRSESNWTSYLRRGTSVKSEGKI